MATQKHQWPGNSDTAHPEVFTTIPPQPETLKPGQLSKEQVQQFFNEGYAIVENYFDTEKELDPVRKDVAELVEILAQKLYNGGKIKNLYSEYGLFERLTKIEEEFPGANILIHKLGHLPSQAVRDLWSNPRLLNMMEQLLGSADIVGHPVWNLRPKTPNNEATTVPWHQGRGHRSRRPSKRGKVTHAPACLAGTKMLLFSLSLLEQLANQKKQDVGYLDNRSYDVLQPTAWIPLLDADEVNGCMQVVRGGHRSGKVATHQCCHGGTWYVMLEKDEMERSLGVDLKKDLLTCPIKYGSFLLINNLIPHRSLNNQSDMIRWSLDLRWQRADLPVAFYDLKQGVPMRSSKDTNLQINWDAFVSVDRHKKSVEYLKLKEDEFDTTLPGPWMKKWEIVHVNRHTEALERSEGSTPWHSQSP